jgi:hypothetical protein
LKKEKVKVKFKKLNSLEKEKIILFTPPLKQQKILKQKNNFKKFG